jgi:hypothetical protein
LTRLRTGTALDCSRIVFVNPTTPSTPPARFAGSWTGAAFAK